MESEAFDAPSPAAAAALSPRSAGVKQRTGGGDEIAGFSFPDHDTSAEKQHRGAPSSSAALSPHSVGVENLRTGEDFEEHGRGVFNPERRGETGGFCFADHDAASSTSIRADDDDFYSRCARIYAPSLSTTPKSPGLTMEAWMASQSQSSRANDTGVRRGLAHAMRNMSAALAPQPHSGSRGWSPMGADTDLGRPYRHVTPASSAVSYPPPRAAASSAQGGGWHPMAHRNQEPTGMGWQDGRPKTELCVQWMTTGACRNGASCRFAHGKEELLCNYVQAGFLCPFRHQCRFRHYQFSTKSTVFDSGLRDH